MLQRMDGQMNRFLADSYIHSTFQLGDNEIYQKVLIGNINLNAKMFYFYMKILSSWPWPQSHPGRGSCWVRL